MEKKAILCYPKGQTAVEYLLLLGIVVTVVLIGFSKYLPRAQQASNLYFQRAGEGILGEPNPCGDGYCDNFETDTTCCVDCDRVGDCGTSFLRPRIPAPSIPGSGIPKPTLPGH